MDTKVVSDLYAWSKDLESSSDVLHREIPAFAMLLGWLEKFLGARGLNPGREACELFWKESVMVRNREGWQIEQRGIVTVRSGKGDKDRTTVLPESLRAEVAEKKVGLRKLYERDRASGLAGTWLPEALARKHPRGGEKWPW